MFKLALSGFKHRWRDYLVLFSGLVMSSAIFYMFEALATNQTFLKQNSMISMISFVFQFGSVLLTIITLVYIGYANSFLLSMRKRDYGLFMLVGARKGKIGQLIWVETLFVGILATIVGIAFGAILTIGVSHLLVQALGLTLKQFSAWYTPAALVTLVLYVGLFLIAGLFNLVALTKTPALKLLHSNDQPNRPRLHPVRQSIEVIIGLASISIGYWSMAHLIDLKMAGIGIALVTIVLGTYLLFNAVFVWLVVLLKRFKWAQRGLNSFTLSQLSFRIRNYTKILSIVAMLFALALGAITTGLGFHQQVPMMAAGGSAYDLSLVNPTAAQKRTVASLNPTRQATYHYKTTSKVVYYNAAEFDQQPFYTANTSGTTHLSFKYAKNNAKQMKKSFYSYQLGDLQTRLNVRKAAVYLPAAAYQKLKQPEAQLLVFATKNFQKHFATFKQLTKAQNKRGANLQIAATGGRYYAYQEFNGMYSGLEFMGFFLGIAFLAMLASCLMFKILSGAAADRQRYRMLDKMGTTQRQLKQALRKEIAVLFVLPGIVGIIHVLFGLQMFKVIMITSPYTGIWLPFTIFAILYLGYYWLTISIYQRIVLQ
ncbi:FtsX-like permease family protein [Lactiplantibacillus daowaiensis]|uniref:FtsX-like permease family protein n=1 Tax=Lactiplantibacillus daowaiensis TaxID=2559918 RepID=A0ABW1S4M5_9LACO|nr:FtsX-like permease family protein [Lactiplantibacillus daowaiensis]